MKDDCGTLSQSQIKNGWTDKQGSHLWEHSKADAIDIDKVINCNCKYHVEKRKNERQ